MNHPLRKVDTIDMPIHAGNTTCGNSMPRTWSTCRTTTILTNVHRKKTNKRAYNKDFKNDEKLNKEDNEEPKEKRQKVDNKKPMDMPRRALSAYNIFFSEQRKRILEDIDRKEEQEKGSNHQKETDDRKENVNSSSSLGDDTSDSDSAGDIQSKKVRQSDTIPCVSKERRSDMKRKKRIHRKVHGKMGLIVMAREISKRWNELSDEDRKCYQDLAAEDKIRHNQAMNQYKELKAAEGMLQIKEQHRNERPKQQQDDNCHHATNPSIEYESTVENSDMMMMNSRYACQLKQIELQRRKQQQQQQQQQRRQQNYWLEMMKLQDPTSVLYNRFQSRQQLNQTSMIGNQIGRRGMVEIDHSIYAPTGANSTSTLPQPPQPVPSATTVHSGQNNVIQLTNFEHKMIMEGRAAAAAASTETMMLFLSSHGNYLEPSNPYYDGHTKTVTPTMCVS